MLEDVEKWDTISAMAEEIIGAKEKTTRKQENET